MIALPHWNNQLSFKTIALGVGMGRNKVHFHPLSLLWISHLIILWAGKCMNEVEAINVLWNHSPSFDSCTTHLVVTWFRCEFPIIGVTCLKVLFLFFKESFQKGIPISLWYQAYYVYSKLVQLSFLICECIVWSLNPLCILVFYHIAPLCFVATKTVLTLCLFTDEPLAF